MPSVNPLQPAEPRRQTASSAPARGDAPFSDLVDETNARRRDAETRPNAADRSKPSASPSRSKARSESLARGEAPAGARPDRPRDAANPARQTASEARASGEAEIAAGTADAEDLATLEDPVDAKPVGGPAQSAAETEAETEAEDASSEVAGQSDSSDNQTTGKALAREAETVEVENAPVPESARPGEGSVASNGEASIETASVASAAATARPGATANKGAAPETASTGQIQGVTAKASATAQSTDVESPGAPAPQPSNGRAAAPTGSAAPVSHPLTNVAGASAGSEADPGGDPDARLPQQPSGAQTAQPKQEFATPRPAEPTHVPLQSNDASAVRAQPNPAIPANTGTEPVRALAASLNPASLHAANVSNPNPVPLNGTALAVEIISRLRDGTRRFDIRLDPPELGRVDVRLEVDRNGNATTRLTVDRPETLELLQREARGLERALHSAGLKTGEGGLEFSLRQQTNDGQSDGRPDSELRGDLIATDDGERIEAVVQGYRSAALARGGIDIRI